MSKSLDAGAFTPFIDGEIISRTMAFNTTCHICGEWLDFSPVIEKGDDGEIETVVFEAGSCGEKFILIPNGYLMVVEVGDGLV